MTPIELSNLYQTLRARVSVHSPNGCTEISLRLPSDFSGELAFYRLVFWGFALVHEAAKVPLAFLTNLPPLSATNLLRQEMSRLRTYVAHNLNFSKEGDQKTYAFVHRWFREACGRGTPASATDYNACCSHLASKLHEALNGAIEACDLLDHPEDGPRLVTDLVGRVDLAWEAHRFDPFVATCASRLGNPVLNLLEIRKRHTEKWRSVLSTADEYDRTRALEQQIEADLLKAIGDTLPLTLRENLQRIVGNTHAIVAALLILRETQRLGTMTLPQIVDLVTSTALGDERSQADPEPVGDD